MGSEGILKNIACDKLQGNIISANDLYVKNKLYVKGKLITNNLVSNQFHDFNNPSMFVLNNTIARKHGSVQLGQINRIGVSDQSVKTANAYFNGTLLRLIYNGTPLESKGHNDESLINNYNNLNGKLKVLDNVDIYGPFSTETKPGDRRKQDPNPAYGEKLAVVNGIKNNGYKSLEIDNELTSSFFFFKLEDVKNLTVKLQNEEKEIEIIHLVTEYNYKKLLEYIASDDNQISYSDNNVLNDDINDINDINNFNKTKNLLEPFQFVEIEFKNNLHYPPLIRTQHINFFQENFDSYPQAGLLHK
jgi:hypothetical protein